MELKRRIRLLGICVLLSTTACGYSFSRTAGDTLPEGTRLAIPVFANDTIQAGFEATLTEALRHEFATLDSIRISRLDDADAVLTGKVLEAGARPLSFDAEFLATEGRLNVIIEAELRRGDEVVWRAERIEVRETYYVTADNVATQENKREALARAAETLARKVALRVRGNWS